jgi:hypothetical protein
VLADALAIAGEYRTDAERLKARIGRVREYAEGKAAVDEETASSFALGMAAAYGEIALKLAVAEHADFNITEADVDDGK